MTDWKRFKDGAGWCVLHDGRIKLEDTELADLVPYVTTDDLGCIRTKGAPKTMRLLLGDCGEEIDLAADMFELPQSWIAGMIAIEARRFPSGHFDQESIRREPGYISDKETPHRTSAGVMQTLLTTARAMCEAWFDDQDFTGPPLVPHSTALELSDLFVPRISILLGAAYMHHQVLRYGEDPIYIVGAYNAGSLRGTSKNPWHVMTYGYSRIPKFAAYHNDWLAVAA